MKIIHVSDTHLVGRGELVYGSDPFVRLTAAVDDIRLNQSDADLCVITGDLAHRGERSEYDLLREALAPLPIPVQLLVGNHDKRDAFRASFPQTPVDDHGFIQSDAIYGNIALFFLDTHEPGTSAGHYCEKRLAWLRNRLLEHAASGRRAILFMHHPPVRIGIGPLDACMLLDQAAMARVVQEAGNVRHVVFGHIHRPLSGVWAGVPISAIRSASHQVKLDFGPAEKLSFDREPPMYGIILVDDDSIVYHYNEYTNSQTV